jgi:hypothetical protein
MKYQEANLINHTRILIITNIISKKSVYKVGVEVVVGLFVYKILRKLKNLTALLFFK